MDFFTYNLKGVPWNIFALQLNNFHFITALLIVQHRYTPVLCLRSASGADVGQISSSVERTTSRMYTELAKPTQVNTKKYLPAVHLCDLSRENATTAHCFSIHASRLSCPIVKTLVVRYAIRFFFLFFFHRWDPQLPVPGKIFNTYQASCWFTDRSVAIVNNSHPLLSKRGGCDFDLRFCYSLARPLVSFLHGYTCRIAPRTLPRSGGVFSGIFVRKKKKRILVEIVVAWAAYLSTFFLLHFSVLKSVPKTRWTERRNDEYFDSLLDEFTKPFFFSCGRSWCLSRQFYSGWFYTRGHEIIESGKKFRLIRVR